MRVGWMVVALACGIVHELRAEPAFDAPLHRVVDLARGELREVELADGRKVRIGLIELEETRDELCDAVWTARVKLSIDGKAAWVGVGNYNLPVTVGRVQVDCTITEGYARNAMTDFWGLEKAARVRLWPARSPLMEPGSMVYPLRQRWFAGDTWMANEPVLANVPAGKIYYHSGLDLGGAEGAVEVVAATEGRVVVAGRESSPDCDPEALTPGYPLHRYTDQVYVMDRRGWYHWYMHLKRIDVRVGQALEAGDRIGVLGKEGASGGWSHLHYEIRSRQPSGKWGTENGYPFIWEAYVRQHAPALIAVAGPIHHRLTPVGREVTLDGRNSRGFAARIASFEWIHADGSTTRGPTAARTYDSVGTYSEVLRIVDGRGNVDYDFEVVEAVEPRARGALPPRLSAIYAPTFGLAPGDSVSFRVRTWNASAPEESWDFGDGTDPVTTRSKGGYAETVHRYEKPGHYLVRVECTTATGRGTARLQVRVDR